MSDRLNYPAIEIAKAAVEQVLIQMNMLPEIITYSQIKKLYGRKMADKARMSEDIEWFPLSTKGTGVSVFCKRSEFSQFLFDRKGYQ